MESTYVSINSKYYRLLALYGLLHLRPFGYGLFHWRCNATVFRVSLHIRNLLLFLLIASILRTNLAIRTAILWRAFIENTEMLQKITNQGKYLHNI